MIIIYKKNVTGAFYIITIGTPAPVHYGIPTGILGLCVVELYWYLGIKWLYSILVFPDVCIEMYLGNVFSILFGIFIFYILRDIIPYDI